MLVRVVGGRDVVDGSPARQAPSYLVAVAEIGYRITQAGARLVQQLICIFKLAQPQFQSLLLTEDSQFVDIEIGCRLAFQFKVF